MMFRILERIKIKLALRSKLRFRRWIELEETKDKILRAARENSDQFPDTIFHYLSAALNVKAEYFESLPWEEVIGLFLLVSSLNVPPQQLPLVSKPSTSKKEKDEWDYAGRTWHLYSHLLAKSYGWSLEYIASLSVEDALAKVQEILTDEQLDKEFLWNMSEASISYNPKTKITKKISLPRPYWMKKEVAPIETHTKLPANLLPMGNIDWTSIPEEFRPKAADTPRDVSNL